MTQMQVLFSESGQIPQLKRNLISKYPDISTDPAIQGGWPIIKSTRVLAFDIFRARIKGYSSQDIIMQFKEMDVHLTLEQLNQAFSFTLEWLYSLHAKKKIRTTK